MQHTPVDHEQIHSNIENIIIECSNQLLNVNDTNSLVVEEIQIKINDALPIITLHLSLRDHHHKTKSLLKSSHLLELIANFLSNHTNDTNTLLLQNAYHYKRYPITQSFITMELLQLTDLRYQRVRHLQELLDSTSLSHLSVLPFQDIEDQFSMIYNNPDILTKILHKMRLMKTTENVPLPVQILIFKEYFINEVSSVVTLPYDDPVYPTEEWLAEDDVPKESLPILTTSYLDIHDYLLRNYILFKKEVFDAAGKDVTDSLSSLQISSKKGKIRIVGHDNNTMPILKYQTSHIGPSKIESDEPTEVIGTIEINLLECKPKWELSKNEILFVANFAGDGKLLSLRGCEVVDITDDKGRTEQFIGNIRKVSVSFDTKQYNLDRDSNIFPYNFLVVIKRNPEVGTFKKILENVQDISKTKQFYKIPTQIQSTILGVSSNLISSSSSPSSIYFADTFLSINQLNYLQPNHSIKQDELKNKHVTFEGDTIKLTDGIITNTTEFSKEEINVIHHSMKGGIVPIIASSQQKKTTVLLQIITNFYKANKRVLLVTHSNNVLNNLIDGILKKNVYEGHVIRLGHGEHELQQLINIDLSKKGRLEKAFEDRENTLTFLKDIAKRLEVPEENAQTCEMAINFMECIVLKRLELIKWSQEEYQSILYRLKEFLPLEILRGNKQRENYIVTKLSKIVAMTSTYAAMQFKEINQHFDLIVVDEAAKLLELEAGVLLLLMGLNGSQHMVMFSGETTTPPIIRDDAVAKYTHFDEGMFKRICGLGDVLKID